MKKASGLKRFEFELDGRRRVVKLPAGATVEELLKKIGRSPETMLATIDGRLVAADGRLKGKVVLYRVVSGG